ncbi:MAG: hypothetical protein JW791_05440 [Nanoarchaeota archaeon]|nr:hypothetical protein [Nanoarchaeota archaeon]
MGKLRKMAVAALSGLAIALTGGIAGAFLIPAYATAIALPSWIVGLTTAVAGPSYHMKTYDEKELGYFLKHAPEGSELPFKRKYLEYMGVFHSDNNRVDFAPNLEYTLIKAGPNSVQVHQNGDMTRPTTFVPDRVTGGDTFRVVYSRLPDYNKKPKVNTKKMTPQQLQDMRNEQLRARVRAARTAPAPVPALPVPGLGPGGNMSPEERNFIASVTRKAEDYRNNAGNAAAQAGILAAARVERDALIAIHPDREVLYNNLIGREFNLP